MTSANVAAMYTNELDQRTLELKINETKNMPIAKNKNGIKSF